MIGTILAWLHLLIAIQDNWDMMTRLPNNPQNPVHKAKQAELMSRVARLVLAEPEKKAVLSRHVVDWALAEFGGYAAMISPEDILNAARDGISRRLQEREREISADLGVVSEE